MIPRFLLIKEMGSTTAILSLILPGLISSYNLILVRTFFQGLPVELFDAARIDGCSEFRTLWRIALPLSMPVLVTVGLFYAVSHWNSYKDAIIFLKERPNTPCSGVARDDLGGRYVQCANTISSDVQTLPESLKAAAVVFSTLPIMCIYPFLQKHFIKGACSARSRVNREKGKSAMLLAYDTISIYQALCEGEQGDFAPVFRNRMWNGFAATPILRGILPRRAARASC
jgi:ABC-type glycerol-3-phosphate transport system permease component